MNDELATTASPAPPETAAEPERTLARGVLPAASRALNHGSRIIAAASLAVLVVVMFIGVFYRYVLHHALDWTGEVAGLAAGWLIFMAAAVLMAKGGHPAIVAFVRRMSEVNQRRGAVLREVCVGVYLLLLLASGIGLTVDATDTRTSALHLSYSLLYAAIPLAGAIMLVHWLAGHGGLKRIVRLAVYASSIVVSGLLWWLTVGAPEPLYAIPLFVLWLTLPIMFALGIPIAIVLGLFSMTMIAFTGTVPLSILTERIYAGIDEPAFLAIPGLILTGTIMLRSGLSEKLVAFASSLVGRVRGGLAISNVIASVFFADISGSAVADTAAIGSVMMPEMKKRGYDPGFVVAHQAASGAMGTLFPPSISMIIYATVTSVSVTTLFLSSLVPGLIVATLFMILAYVLARRNNYPREAKSSSRELARAWVGALPAFGAVVLVLGGILGGVFTPPEAGAIAAGYVFAVALGSGGIRGGLRATVTALREAAETTAMVMFIIANAAVMAWMMISFQIPQTVVGAIGSLTTDATVVTLLICLVLVALAMFLEPPAILIAVVPIVLPLEIALGVDPIHFGVIVMLTTTIGMMIPPIGITLLVAAGILKVPLETAARAALQHVVLVVATLLLVILVPAVTGLLTTLLS